MPAISILLSLFFLCPEITLSQAAPIHNNQVCLQHPRDTVHLQKLPFRTISVLDGRMDTTDAVGTYRMGKKANFRFAIPLHLDTSVRIAVGPDRF